MRRRLGAILATLLVVGGGALAAQAAPDPAVLVLQAADLPTGMTRDSARYRTNVITAKENGVSLALLRRWGRVTGYEAGFSRSVDAAKPPGGPLTVTSNVSTYRSASGLRQAFLRSARSIETSGAPNPAYRRLALGTNVGDESRLYTGGFTQAGVPVVVYTIVWRAHGALGFLNVAGVRGKLTPGDVVALARRQQARIAGRAKPDEGSPGPVA